MMTFRSYENWSQTELPHSPASSQLPETKNACALSAVTFQERSEYQYAEDRWQAKQRVKF